MNSYTLDNHLVIVAGGTGGHIFPALSVINQMCDLNLVIITDQRGEEYFIDFFSRNKMRVNLKKIKFKIHVHNVVSPSNKSYFNKIISIYKIFHSILKSFSLFIFKRPALVIGFGGYPSVGPIIAAKFLKIKTIIHEQNAIMGRANNILSKISNCVATSFVNTKIRYSSKKSIYIGNPVREEFYKVGNLKYKAPQVSEKFYILIIGGSLGASFLSEQLSLILCSLPLALKKRLKVFHQVKFNEIEKVKDYYIQNNIDNEINYFFENVFEKFKKAHLIISRAGGSSVAEILASKRPVIFIPLPTALDNHQKENAQILENINGGWIIEQNCKFFNKCKKLIQELMDDPGKLTKANLQISQLTEKLSKLRKNNTPSKFFVNIIIKFINSSDTGKVRS